MTPGGIVSQTVAQGPRSAPNAQGATPQRPPNAHGTRGKQGLPNNDCSTHGNSLPKTVPPSASAPPNPTLGEKLRNETCHPTLHGELLSPIPKPLWALRATQEIPSRCEAGLPSAMASIARMHPRSRQPPRSARFAKRRSRRRRELWNEALLAQAGVIPVIFL